MYNFQTYLQESGILKSLGLNEAAILSDVERARLTNAAIREMYRVWQEARYMLYDPQWYQLMFHQDPSPVRSIIGGNKTGKTLAGGMEIFWGLSGNYPAYYPEELRIKQPSKIHLGVTDFKEIGGDVWLPMMKDWFPQWDNPKVWEKSKRKQVVDTQFVYLPTGSELLMLSDQMDVGSFEGWQSDLFLFDEPFDPIKYAAIHRGLLIRHGRFIFTATPLKMCYFAKREFIDKSQLGVNHDGRTFCIQPTMDDNRFLTKREIDEFIDRVPEDQKRTRRYGELHSASRLVFESMADRITDFMVPDRDVDPNWTQSFALDPHPRAPWAGLYSMIGPEGILVIFDEVWEKDMILDPFAKLLFEREAQESHACRGPDFKWIDWWCGKPDQKSGKSYVEMFQDAQYFNFVVYEKFSGSVDAHRELCKNRSLDIETMIPDDSWLVHAGYVKPGKYNGPGVLIMDRCKNFRYSLENLTFEDQKRRTSDSDPNKREVESLAHLTDCWKMIEAGRPYWVNRNRNRGIFGILNKKTSKQIRHHPCSVRSRRRG